MAQWLSADLAIRRSWVQCQRRPSWLRLFQVFYPDTPDKCQYTTCNLSPGWYLPDFFILPYPILSRRCLRAIKKIQNSNGSQMKLHTWPSIFFLQLCIRNCSVGYSSGNLYVRNAVYVTMISMILMGLVINYVYLPVFHALGITSSYEVSSTENTIRT